MSEPLTFREVPPTLDTSLDDWEEQTDDRWGNPGLPEQAWLDGVAGEFRRHIEMVRKRIKIDRSAYADWLTTEPHPDLPEDQWLDLVAAGYRQYVQGVRRNGTSRASIEKILVGEDQDDDEDDDEDDDLPALPCMRCNRTPRDDDDDLAWMICHDLPGIPVVCTDCQTSEERTSIEITHATLKARSQDQGAS